MSVLRVDNDDSEDEDVRATKLKELLDQLNQGNTAFDTDKATKCVHELIDWWKHEWIDIQKFDAGCDRGEYIKRSGVHEFKTYRGHRESHVYRLQASIREFSVMNNNEGFRKLSHLMNEIVQNDKVQSFSYGQDQAPSIMRKFILSKEYEQDAKEWTAKELEMKNASIKKQTELVNQMQVHKKALESLGVTVSMPASLVYTPRDPPSAWFYVNYEVDFSGIQFYVTLDPDCVLHSLINPMLR